MKKVHLIAFLLCFSAGLFSQPVERNKLLDVHKTYQTTRIPTASPVIDGLLDDEAWEAVDWTGGFTQRSPHDGEAPTRETEFKILYDEKYLYIGFRCHDDEPEKIVRRMSRRDGFDGDWVEVNIDSYNDKRTAFSFTTSVSGVKGDEFISDNGSNWDPSWNPIWYAKTNIDEQGWTAEIKIPFSQIRYADRPEHTWGIQVTRRDFREESRSVWRYVPQNDGNWVSNFGALTGLVGVKPQKQIEIQPYVVAQAETFEKEVGNPYADGSSSKITAGLDGKIGVTGDLTLDFTINPDFGQVDADPAALTLDGYRIFFAERRPFFIENRNVFDYQYSSAITGGPFTSDNLFYSRRIGSSPSRYPNLANGEYTDVPDNTTILGAAKFSGKTRGGMAIGILESVTAKEMATISLDGEEREEVVEPLTNYFVGRMTQDFKEGQTVIGGILTAVNRDLSDPGLGFLHRSAYSGGLDITHWWKDRTYYLVANGVFSQVQGSTEAILRTQTAFEHNFQRPDADYLEVDSSATAMTGHGGMVKVGRSNKNWMFETGVTWRSPNLELNDIGFMTNTNEISYFLWTGYRFTKPFSVFRFLQVNYNHWLTWDFGGTNLYQAVNTNAHTMFNNFWRLSAGVTYENKDISNNALFGGPALRRSFGVGPWLFIGTDNRKPVQFSLNASKGKGFERNDPKTVEFQSYSLGITVQPTNAFNITLSPGYNTHRRKIQYVTDRMYQGEARYLAGTVDQRTASMVLRMNYSITPNLTVQYYGQPFISRGRYTDFKRITNPLAKDFNDRFHLFSPEEIQYDQPAETYRVDEDRNGSVDYSFNQPDFNFIQFRSNLVGRWEYIPGSELFLVWSQGTTFQGDPQDQLLPSLTENVFERKARNIFLIKITYRFLM